MSNVEETREIKPEPVAQERQSVPTDQQLRRQYEKYLKHIDVRPKIVKDVIASEGRVCYLVNPATDKYKHPPYQSFGMRMPLLSLEKQLQFVRGSNPFFQTTAKIVSQLIQSDSNGLVKRKRNRAILFPSGKHMSYVYARGQHLRRLDLQLSDNKVQIHYSKEFDKLNGRINEVQLHEQSLIVRTLYRLKFFALDGQPQLIVPEEKQIIGSMFNPFKKNELVVNTYGSDTTIRRYDTTGGQPTLSDEFHCEGLARAVQCIDYNSIIIASGDCSIRCLDTKANRQTTLRQMPEQLYELQWLRSAYGNTSFYSTISRSRIEIFDIRNAGKAMVSIKHLSEECPPDILQYFVGNPRPCSLKDKLNQRLLKLDQPIIVAHSPYRQSNCMFLRFGQESNPTTTKLNLMGSLLSGQCSNRGDSSSPNLLFDSGKLFNEAKPTSINPVMLSRDRLAFLQSDSCNGVSLQAFQLSSIGNDSNVLYEGIPMEPQGKLQDARNLSESLNQERALRLQSQKYLEPCKVKLQPGVESSDQQVTRRGMTERRRTFVCRLDHFRRCLYDMADVAELESPDKDNELGPTMDTFASQNINFDEFQPSSTQSEIFNGYEQLDVLMNRPFP